MQPTDSFWLYKGIKDGVLVDVIFRSTGDIYLDEEMLERSSVEEFKGPGRPSGARPPARTSPRTRPSCYAYWTTEAPGPHEATRPRRRPELTWVTRGDRAEVEVRDDGTFRRAISDAEGSHGRGILLMMSVMDQITISCGTDARPGTVVRMVKFKNGRAARPQTGSVERAADHLPTASRQAAS